MLDQLRWCTAVLCLPAAVAAAPQGAQVVHGSASIHSIPNQNLTQITAGHNSIIEYQSFSIGTQETVQFIQPSAQARVLNRVMGMTPSQINGVLQGNGRVYLVNPAGIFFGNSAVVDVGALFAAAGRMSNQDFLSGVNAFTDLSGEVVNWGQIEAGAIHLFGRSVTNYGSVYAHDGVITMVAGEEVWLSDGAGNIFVEVSGGDATGSGVDNSGVVDASGGEVFIGAGDIYALAIRNSGTVRGGEITLNGGESGLVEVSGVVDATDAGHGGDIAIAGGRVGLYGATIDASGDTGGGTITIGGDNHGEGKLPAAEFTYIDEQTILRADAYTTGDGGQIDIWSEIWTRFDALASAKGGSQSGDGGFIDVSGKMALYYSGAVDLAAPNGRMGTLLFDPYDIEIYNGTGQGNDGQLPDLSNATVGAAGTFQISEQALEGLAAGSNLILEARNDITLFDLSDDLLNLAINGTGSVIFTADSDSDGSGSFTYGDTADEIRTAGGSLTINAYDVDIGDVNTGGGDFTVNAVGDIATYALTTGTTTLTSESNVHVRDTSAFSGVLTANSDSDGDGSGKVTFDNPITVANQNAILEGEDVEIQDTFDVGTGSLQVTNTSGDLGIGDGLGTMTITTTELDRITAGSMVATSVDDIIVDNVTAGDTANIGPMTLTAADEVHFSGSDSTFTDSLIVAPGDKAHLWRDLTSSTGDITFNGPVIMEASESVAGTNVTFASTVDSDGLSRNLTVNASGVTSFLGEVGGTSEILTLMTDAAGSTIIAGDVTTDGWQLFGDALTFSGGGTQTLTTNGLLTDITFGSTADKATGDLSLSAIDDITLSGAVTLSDGSLVASAMEGITVDAISARGVSLSAWSDVDVQGAINATGAVLLDGDSNSSLTGDVYISGSVTTADTLLTMEGRDLILTGTIDSGTATTVFNDTSGLVIGVGTIALLGPDISNAELANITAGELSLNTGGSILVNNVLNASTTGIANLVTLNGAGGTVSFQTNASSFAQGVTATANIGVDVDVGLTTDGTTLLQTNFGDVDINQALSTTNNTLTVAAPDIDLGLLGSIDSGTATTTFNPSTNASIRLVGSGLESSPFDLNNSSLAKITADTLQINATGTGSINVDGVSAAGTANIATQTNLSSDGGSVTFNGSASNFAQGVFATADSGVTVDIGLTTDGATLLQTTTGSVDINQALSTTNNSLTVTAPDLNFGASGSVDSGSAGTTLNPSTNASIRLVGAGAETNPFDLNNSSLAKITADSLLVNATGTGSISADGVSAVGTGNISTQTTLSSDGGSVTFSGSASNFAQALTASADTGVSVGAGLTTAGATLLQTTSGSVDVNQALSTTNNTLTIAAPDLNFGASGSSDSGTANTILNPPTNASIRLVGAGAETNPFDLSNNSLGKVTANSLLVNATGTGSIDVDGVSAAGVANIASQIGLSSESGSITFNGSASLFPRGLQATTDSAIDVSVDLTTGDTTTLTADNDDDGTGTLTVAGNLDSGDSALNLKAADVTVTGTIDSGAAATSWSASSGRSIGLGSVSAGLDLSLAELDSMTSTGMTFTTTTAGDIQLNGLTAAATATIGGITTFSAAEDVILSGSDSTITGGAAFSPTGQTTLGENFTANTGAVSFTNHVELTDDITITQGSGLGVTFNNTVDSDSGGTPRTLTVATSGAGTIDFVGDIGDTFPLTALNVGKAQVRGFHVPTIIGTAGIDFLAAEQLEFDTSITAAGAVNITGTLDSDATLRDLTIVSNDTVTLGGDLGIGGNYFDQLSVTSDSGLAINNDIKANTISLYSGNDGTGDLTFGAGAELLSPSTTLQAGDGAGGTATASIDAQTNSPTFRGLAGGATSPTTFVMRQDAALTDANLPAGAQFPGGGSGMALTLDSDEASVTIGTGSRVASTDLTLEGATGVTISDAINVNTLDVTGTATLSADITSTATQDYNSAVLMNDDIVMTGTDITFDSTVDSQTLNRGLTINGSGTTTFSGDVGSTMRLASLSTDSAGTASINTANILTTNNLILSDTLSFGTAGAQLLDSLSGTLRLQNTATKALGDLTLSGGGAIDLNADVAATAGSLNVSEPFTATHDLTAGTNITLSGAGTLDGTGAQVIDAQGGTLTAVALTKASGDLTLGGGSAIDLNGAVDATVGALTVSDAFSAVDDLTAGANVTLSGAGTFDGASDQVVNAGTGTLSATSTLTKTGAGNLILAGDTLVDVDGAIDVQAGNLVVSDVLDAEANITSSGSSTFSGAATFSGDLSAVDGTFNSTLVLDGGNQVLDATTGTLTTASSVTKTSAGNLTLAGDTLISASGAIDVQAGNLVVNDAIDAELDITSSGSSTFNAASTLAADLTAVDGTFNGTLTLDGSNQVLDATTGTLSATSTITKTSAGNLTLAGDTIVDVDGAIDVQSGNLVVSDAIDVEGNVSSSGSSTFNAGVTLAGDLSAVDATFNGTLTLDGGNQQINAGTGTVTTNSGVTKSSAGNLTLAGDTLIDANSTISVSAGDLMVMDAIDGEGAIGASGTATFTGSATLGDDVVAGTVWFQQPTTLDGSGAQTLSATSGSLTAGSINKSSAGTLNLSGSSGIALGGGSVSSVGDQTYTGDLTFGSSLAISGASLTFNDNVDGAFDLTLLGSGSTLFSQEVGGSAAIGSGGASGLDIQSTGTTTFASSLSTAGNLEQADAAGNVTFGGNTSVGGTTTLNSDVTFGGVTFTSAGALQLGNSGADSITLSGGPTTLTTAATNSAITIDGAIDGALDLTLNAGTGALDLNGVIGGVTPLDDLTVSGGAVTLNGQLEANNTVAFAASDDLVISGATDASTITLSSANDLSIGSALEADALITGSAGSDGTGGVSSSAGATIDTLDPGGQVILSSGSSSGNIAIGESITSDALIQIGSPAGVISQSGGTLTSGSVQLTAANGIGVATPLQLSTQVLSASTTLGALNLVNTSASGVSANLLQTNTGNLTLAQSGGGALTVMDARTSGGDIFLSNTGGALILNPSLPLGRTEAGGSGSVTLTTLGSGSIHLGDIRALDGTITITSAGDIQDAQDDLQLDVDALRKVVTAVGTIGGRSLVGNRTDIVGNVEIEPYLPTLSVAPSPNVPTQVVFPPTLIVPKVVMSLEMPTYVFSDQSERSQGLSAINAAHMAGLTGNGGREVYPTGSREGVGVLRRVVYGDDDGNSIKAMLSDSYIDFKRERDQRSFASYLNEVEGGQKVLYFVKRIGELNRRLRESYIAEYDTDQSEQSLTDLMPAEMTPIEWNNLISPKASQ